MRVGVVAYLAHGGPDYRAAGVSSYTIHLLSALARTRSDVSLHAFVGADAPPLTRVQVHRVPWPATNPVVRIAMEQTLVPLQQRFLKLDVLHGAVNVLPRFNGTRGVVTVHDLAFLRHPERFRRGRVRYLTALSRWSVLRADHVIAVSQSTRSDLSSMLGVKERKVSVIYPGVDPDFTPFSPERLRSARPQHLDGRPYILYVGTLEPRKNLDVLIAAYASARRTLGFPHALALVGGAGWGVDPLRRLVENLGLQDDVKFVGFVPAVELPGWYNCAELFAYPSEFEGFGLPLLEAMACGVPAITSSLSSLGELAGDACTVVNSGSLEELQLALEHLLTDEAERNRLRREGLTRAAHFSWERTALETARVYELVMASRPW